MDYLNSRFVLTRGSVLKTIEEISPEIVDVQPEGFNNTIRWHIGHIVTSAEQILLGYPQTTNLPANYLGMFGYGTKPADWTGDIPSVEELANQLKEQQNRLLEIPEKRLTEKLEEPFLGMETVGEIVSLTLFHESNHLGQIEAMKRMIETKRNK